MMGTRITFAVLAGMLIVLNHGFLRADEGMGMNLSDGQDSRSKSVPQPEANEAKIEFRLVAIGGPVEGLTEKEGFQKGYSGQRSMVYPYKKPFFTITRDKIAMLTVPPNQAVGTIRLSRKAQSEMFVAMNTPEAKSRVKFTMFANGKRLTTGYVGAYGSGRNDIALSAFDLRTIFGDSFTRRPTRAAK